MAKPAPLIALKDVRLQDGPRPLFEGVDMAIAPRSRAALVGRNGTGKSTLMKLVMGLIEADEGERAVQAGTRFAWVPQEPDLSPPARPKAERLREPNDRAQEWTLLDYASSGPAERWQAEAWLATFGLDPNKPAQRLSGGETRRAALAKAFAEEPELLLLDEPTNHLDILAIQTLEEEILSSRSAVLVVSHDRAFLNRVTDTVHWLEHRKVRTLNKGFADFDAWAAKVQEEEAESLRRLTKRIEAETYTFYRSITAQRTRNEGRAERLNQMRLDRAERLKDLPRELNLSLDTGTTSGKLVAELKGVSRSFGDRTILKPFTTRILRGDRLGIVGPNGAGKTTLVKLLLGELEPDAGTVRLGSNLQVVYLDQAREGLKDDMTLWDALTPGGGDSILVGERSVHVAAYAKDFLFQESQLKQPISTLSGGERSRLLIARALARPANLLVLDEPTNDLDMETLDKLEELLEAFDGTLILVSHDRDFVDRLASSTLALNGRGDIVETPGGWSDFIRQNPGFLSPPSPSPAGGGSPPRSVGGVGAAGQSERDPVEISPPGAARQPPRDREGEPRARTTSRKLSYKDARRLEEVETLIETLPDQIAAHEATLADPGLYTRDPAAFDRAMKAAEKARAELELAESDWLRIEELKAGLEG